MKTETNAIPGLETEDLSRIAAVWAAPDAKLATLIRAAQLDPTKDFKNVDLRGWPLAGQDVRGIDFSGSDLRGTGFEAAIRDQTTIIAANTKLDTPLSSEPIENLSQAEALSTTRELLEKAKASLKAKDHTTAFLILGRASAIIQEYAAHDFLSWASLDIQATLIHRECISNRKQHSTDDWLAELERTLSRLVQNVPHDSRAAQILFQLSSSDLNRRKFPEYAQIAKTYVRQSLVLLRKKNSTETETFVSLYTLLGAEFNLLIRFREFAEAENIARELVRVSAQIDALEWQARKTNPIIRAQVWLARAIWYQDRFDESRMILQRAIEYGIANTADPFSTATYTETLRAIELFLEMEALKTDAVSMLKRFIDKIKEYIGESKNISLQTTALANKVARVIERQINRGNLDVARLLADFELALRWHLVREPTQTEKSVAAIKNRSRLVKAAKRFFRASSGAHLSQALDIAQSIVSECRSATIYNNFKDWKNLSDSLSLLAMAANEAAVSNLADSATQEIADIESRLATIG